MKDKGLMFKRNEDLQFHVIISLVIIWMWSCGIKVSKNRSEWRWSVGVRSQVSDWFRFYVSGKERACCSVHNRSTDTHTHTISNMTSKLKKVKKQKVRALIRLHVNGNYSESYDGEIIRWWKHTPGFSCLWRFCVHFFRYQVSLILASEMNKSFMAQI